MKKYQIAIVGATGAVGQEIIRLLGITKFPVKSLKLLASERSAGQVVCSAFGELTVKAFSPQEFVDQDIVFFATSGEHARQYAPQAVAMGAVVIDNSSAFRLDDEVPLIVPEVNPEAIAYHKGIIANANCSTIQMVVALNPLHKVSKIKRIVVSSYQAVSGAGVAAIDELKNQQAASLKGESVSAKAFTKPIANNVIPHIDVFMDNGYTKEEMKMVLETRKIMSEPKLKISATCVRVPVIRAHSEAINIETQEYIGERKAKEILESSAGIKVLDTRADGGYPTPLDASETPHTWVGRIRDDISCDNGLALWCVADQLWKGAALNAVQIAELAIKAS